MTTLQAASGFHHLASNPSAHVWVEASAGTGKTRSLTDRVLRLLLAGVPPESLFAISFTRTAAAEMQKRVFDRLAAWARLDDAPLDSELATLGEAPSADLRARARALFLKVLDSPRGLEIRTIHASAQALLSAFPVEAGLPPHVDPLDERTAATLRARALAEALEDAGLAADFERIAIESGADALTRRLADLARAHPGYARIGGPADVEPFLRGIAGLAPGLSPQTLLEAAVAPPAFDDGAVAAFRDVVAVAGRKDLGRANACIDGWPGWSPAARVANLPDLLNLVFDSAGKKRGTKNIAKRLEGGETIFERLLAEVEKIVELRRALACVEHAGAWLRIGMGIAGRYRRLKRAAAAVDFDDMVGMAADLVHQHGMANAVAERLDRQILHILVDEAQDTNAAQWRLVEGLAGEFDTGLGQHEGRLRTRFVVGDFKQAIFRFQGTDPRIFLAVRARWGETTRAAGRPITDVPLSRNFRSAPLILHLVDEVMQALGPAAIGLTAGTSLPRHEAARAALPGRVLLFPPHVVAAAAENAEGEEEGELADPEFATTLARRIAALVAEGSPERMVLTDRDGRNRWAGPGDVLILLRKRGDLMTELVRALHAAKLPVAGVDRARLAEPLAVRDLLSLVRFVLQPADDLALAELLTSPLGGLMHEEIRRLRQPGSTLWQSLEASADPAQADVKALLGRARARADFASPHAFLEAVLAEGGRAAFRARLGPEADDGIDALLAEALAFERDHPATLQGFLAHVSGNEGSIRREPDSSPGLVRLMTVHGAKGLEAPIVVLADAATERQPRPTAVTWRWSDGASEVPVIFGRRDRLPAALAPLVEQAAQAEAAEESRLLYVALTRAEQLLLVAGQVSPSAAAKREKEPEAANSWHDHVHRALEAMGATWQENDAFGRHLALESAVWPPPDAVQPTAPPQPVPAWAISPPPPEPEPRRPFTPSQPGPDEAPSPPPGPAQRAAAERGIRLHKLFEHLPGLAPEARRAAGMRILQSLGETDPEPLVRETLPILEDPGFAPLFGPESLAEAPLAGHVDGLTVSGTVDRLWVTPDRVLVVDLKTGLAVPEVASAVHPSHLRQMAAYRAVLRAAFPGRRVEAALLYTAAPRLLVLDDSLLDLHWPPGRA